ncbi:MAG: phenylalanine--tRNA ligase subunit beta [Candidatus Omnitrophota bacterium]
MKISYNWLKDYVTIRVTPEKLAQQLTMLGLEVVDLEKIDGDTVFEIEVTSNRPDWLNVIGIAREIATASGVKIKTPPLTQKTKAAKGKFIQIRDKTGCPRYIGKIIEGVKVRPAPELIQKRLKAVGLRPVNNIVDITNYVLMELGQPLHAFDLGRLAENRLVVRRAKAEEEIVTIDAEARKLNPEILIIADAQKPVAIAGIMGGKDSEVNEGTKNILLESAYFNPLLIRRATRLLGISSESSYRFERSVDMPMVELASDRAVNLIAEFCGGRLTAICDIKPAAKKAGAKAITITSAEISRQSGSGVSLARIKTVFSGLGLKVSSGKRDDLKITAPSFRPDLKEPVDLLEEAARHLGYDRLPATLPAIKVCVIPEQPMRKLKAEARRVLTAAGLNEIISYSLISREMLEKLGWDEFPAVAVQNPLSRDQEIMAPTLLAGTVSAMRNNLNHGIEAVNIFEIGKVYRELNEAPALAMGIMTSEPKPALYTLKGAIEALCNRLGIAGLQIAVAPKKFFAPGLSFSIKISQTDLGYLGQLSSAGVANFDFKHRSIVFAQLNLDQLLTLVKWDKAITVPINFPSVRRDISLIVKAEILSGSIVELLKQSAGPLLKEIKLVDQYSGKQIPAAYKGLTYALEFQSSERTLSDEEVNLIHQKLCMLLEEQLKAQVRK